MAVAVASSSSSFVTRATTAEFAASPRVLADARVAELGASSGDWSAVLFDVAGVGKAAKNNDEAAEFAARRLPFRTSERTEYGTGARIRSIRGRLFGVASKLDSFATCGAGAVGLSPESLELGFDGFGVAPVAVVRSFTRELRRGYAATARKNAGLVDAGEPAEFVTFAYVVYSYETPIAWDVFSARRSASLDDLVPVITSSARTDDFLGERRTRRVYATGRTLAVPDIRYSQSTSQHQGILNFLYSKVEGGNGTKRVLVPAAERFGAGVELVRISTRVDVGDPGEFRRGRGQSPLGSRGW